jgi:hypothetical protein
MVTYRPRPIRRLPFYFGLPSRAVWENLARRMFGFLLLLSLTTFGQAMESWTFPDLREEDKQEHAAAGAIIAMVSDFAIREYYPAWSDRKRFLVDSAIATAAGIAKEIWDDRRGPKRDTCDPADAIATSLGGIGTAASITLMWRF